MIRLLRWIACMSRELTHLLVYIVIVDLKICNITWGYRLVFICLITRGYRLVFICL
jgi:short subunit fatty acids transporter